MGLGLLYWIFWLIAVVGEGGLVALQIEGPGPGLVFLAWAVMAFLVGWKVFGLPITGRTE